MHQLGKFETAPRNSCRETDGTGVLIAGLLIGSNIIQYGFVLPQGGVLALVMFNGKVKGVNRQILEDEHKSRQEKRHKENEVQLIHFPFSFSWW